MRQKGEQNIRPNPIRSLRSSLPESFEEDMKRIKKEREKSIQEISDKCMTAGDFVRFCQDSRLNTKKENYKE